MYPEEETARIFEKYLRGIIKEASMESKGI
jgi:hypothetical protein